MSVLPIMILASLLVAVGAAIAFFWAVEHDQFEDLESPGFLPLLDDSPRPQPQQPGSDRVQIVLAVPSESIARPRGRSIERPDVARSRATAFARHHRLF